MNFDAGNGTVIHILFTFAQPFIFKSYTEITQRLHSFFLDSYTSICYNEYAYNCIRSQSTAVVKMAVFLFLGSLSRREAMHCQTGG